MERMERMEILKDYVSYCKSLKLDAAKKVNQKKYVNLYIKNLVQYKGIKNADFIQKDITDTLKYNPLTITKLSKEV